MELVLSKQKKESLREKIELRLVNNDGRGWKSFGEALSVVLRWAMRHTYDMNF